MKTLKHLRIVLVIASIIAMFIYATVSLSKGIPPYYDLFDVLIEIGVAIGYMFIIYSGIYFFLRLIFFLADRKKSTPKRNSQNSPASSLV